MTPDELKRGTLADATTRTGGVRITLNPSRQSRIESLPRASRVVRRTGISLHSIRYRSDALAAWIGNPKKMEIRYDPRDLSRIYLGTPDGDYYELTYRELRRPPISLSEHQLALQHLRKAKRVDVDEEAIFRTVKNMRESASEARQGAKNARCFHARGLRFIQAGPMEPGANSALEKSRRTTERPGKKGRQPRRRRLTAEERF